MDSKELAELLRSAKHAGAIRISLSLDDVEELVAASGVLPVQQPIDRPSATIERLPFAIMPDEMAALRRFDECSRDGEGYDVDAMMMKALAGIGLVRHLSAGRYEYTTFGLSVLAGDFDLATPAAAQQPAIPDHADALFLLSEVLDAHDCAELEYIDGDHTEPTERFSEIVARIRALVKPKSESAA